MTDAQRQALTALCKRYQVPFDEDDYHSDFDLPSGYVAGWVGGPILGSPYFSKKPTIYVGCSEDGEISS